MHYRVIYSNGYSTIFVDVKNTRKMFRMIAKDCKRMTAYDLHRYGSDLYFYAPTRVLRIYKIEQSE